MINIHIVYIYNYYSILLYSIIYIYIFIYTINGFVDFEKGLSQGWIFYLNFKGPHGRFPGVTLIRLVYWDASVVESDTLRVRRRFPVRDVGLGLYFWAFFGTIFGGIAIHFHNQITTCWNCWNQFSNSFLNVFFMFFLVFCREHYWKEKHLLISLRWFDAIEKSWKVEPKKLLAIDLAPKLSEALPKSEKKLGRWLRVGG